MQVILAQYSLGPVTPLEDLGNAGGFSGAHFWRLGERQQLCLRRWPNSNPDVERLSYIHGVLIHASRQGLDFLPVPLRTALGETFVRHKGTLWEVTNWLPGTAEEEQPPRKSRLISALRVLAQFHNAVESYPVSGTSGSPPGIRQRFSLLQELKNGLLERCVEATQQQAWPELRERSLRYALLFPQLVEAVERQLVEVTREEVRLLPCIRDVRRDHLLFVADEVRGLVDFGTMRPDCPTGDIARLLGGFVADDLELQAVGLAAYREIRPLSSSDIARVRAFDAANVLMSIANWLRWISLEGRHFDRPQAILSLIDEWLLRLEQAVRTSTTK